MVFINRKNSDKFNSYKRIKIINEIPKAEAAICIINDSDTLREDIYSTLKNEYNIDEIVKTSKKDYIKKHMTKIFDVIITDIEFADGIDTSFINQINSIFPKTRIIVYTNPQNRTQRIRSLEYGANYFIFMDDDLLLLQFVVRKIIEKPIELD
ncbi:MAG: response regulator [Melioribacteraceae bacterium]|nr:response regulator [Melioribacteraceae bacterium]